MGSEEGENAQAKKITTMPFEKALAIYANYKRVLSLATIARKDFEANRKDIIPAITKRIKEVDLPEINSKHKYKIEDLEVRLDEQMNDLCLVITKITADSGYLYEDDLQKEYWSDVQDLSKKYFVNYLRFEVEQVKRDKEINQCSNLLI